MKNNCNTTPININSTLSNAEICATEWFGLKKDVTKKYNFQNKNIYFLLSPQNNLFQVIEMAIKCEFAPIKIVVDERMTNEDFEKICKLGKNMDNKFAITKSKYIIPESYFCVNKNILISSTIPSKNGYSVTTDTVIKNAGKKLLKDFFIMFKEHLLNTAEHKKTSQQTQETS